MKKRIRYTNEPIKSKPVKDFLPPPGTFKHSPRPLKVMYDKQTDTLTMTFRSGAVKESEEVTPGLIVDRDAAGAILGVELLDASKKGVDPKGVEFAVS